MSAKIHLLRTNILKNKNASLFCKTFSSNFYHRAKPNNLISDFTLTKSTKFSDNNLTNTLPSSKKRLSKNKEDPLFIGSEDFHKKFNLNKNNTIDINNLRNYKNNNHKTTVINLKKSSIPHSFYSSTESKSGINSIIKNNTLKINKNNKEKNVTISFQSFKDENDENIFNNYERNNHFNEIKTFQNNNFKYKLFDSEYKKNKKYVNLHKNLNIFKNYKKSIPNNNSKNKEFKKPLFSFSEKIDKNRYSINSNNRINTEKKEDKIKLYYHRNKIKLFDILSYPDIYNPIKTETSQDFYYKTKTIILYNYRKYLNKNAYMKYFVKKNFEEEKELIQENNVKTFDKLFTFYEKDLYNYLQFLKKKVRIILDENEHLVKDKYQIIGEINRIKINIMKRMSEIRNGLSVKYFLTCVKNHTLCEDDFNPEDLKEIQEDRKKLYKSYYKNKYKKRKSLKKLNASSNILLNTSHVRKIQEHSLTKKLKRTAERELSNFVKNSKNKNFPKKISKDYQNIKVSKRFKIFNSVEEFYENLDFISSNVYNLIIDCNDRYITNAHLKLELENLSKNIINTSSHSNYYQNEINLNENILDELKSKSKLLLSNLNKLKSHQFKRETGYLLVLKNIHRIYLNLKKENKEIIDITKEMIISYGERFYLKIIEQFFFKKLYEVNSIKKRKPNEYKNFKLQLDKCKKKESFYNFQRFLAEKIQIKIDKVLQKANKLYLKPHKKTNDYKKESKKHKVIKKEIKKSNLEIFADFLYDDSYL